MQRIWYIAHDIGLTKKEKEKEANAPTEKRSHRRWSASRCADSELRSIYGYSLVFQEKSI